MRELKFFDTALRTAYAQAKEIALSQRQIPLVTPGSLQVERRGDRRFVYRYRYQPSGQRVSEYLGPEDDEATIAKVANVGDELREAALLAESSRDLRRVGFHSADNSTMVTVASIFNAGIFGGGGMLVGTHAFGALLNELGVRAAPVMMTEDVDLARPSRIQIAALPKGGLLALLRDTGLPFHEVPQLRRNAPATSYKVRGHKLTVDLLIPAKGKPYEPVEVPELGAHATGLPHFRFLLEEPIQSVLLGRDRIVPVVVPHPGRFCIHKMAVYSLRSGSHNAKRDKDVLQAALLAAALAENQEFLLTDAASAMDGSLRSKVKAGVGRVLALLGSEHPAATGLLSSLS